MIETRIASIFLLGLLTLNAASTFAGVPEKETGNTATRKPIRYVSRMFPDGTEYDFGRVVRGDLCKHSFRIVNTCGVPLRIVSIRIH